MAESIPFKLKFFIRLSEMAMGPLYRTSPRRARRITNNNKWNWIRDKRVEVGLIKEENIDLQNRKIGIRFYYPNGKNNSRSIIYFHGGGFIIGGLDSHDSICRRMCFDNSATVISIDYRQGPEFKFPAAHVDAIEAVGWIIENASRLELVENFIVAGDSAGGNLAANVSLAFPNYIQKQILIYPVTDFAKEKPFEKIKYNFFTSRRDSEWYSNYFLNSDEDRLDPRLSLILRKDLAKSPATFLLTAEHDILKFEGNYFANKLRNEGVKIMSKEYKEMVHGFLSFPRWASEAENAFRDIRNFVGSSD